MRSFKSLFLLLGVSCVSGDFDDAGLFEPSDTDLIDGVAFARPVSCIQLGKIVVDHSKMAIFRIKATSLTEDDVRIEACVRRWVNIRVPPWEEFVLKNDCASEIVSVNEDGSFSMTYKIEKKPVKVVLNAEFSPDGEKVLVRGLGAPGSYQLVRSAELHKCPGGHCQYDPDSCEGIYQPPQEDMQDEDQVSEVDSDIAFDSDPE